METRKLGIREIIKLLEEQLNKLDKKERKVYSFWLKNIYRICRKRLLNRMKEFINNTLCFSNIKNVLNDLKEKVIECLEQMPKLSLS